MNNRQRNLIYHSRWGPVDQPWVKFVPCALFAMACGCMWHSVR